VSDHTDSRTMGNTSTRVLAGTEFSCQQRDRILFCVLLIIALHHVNLCVNMYVKVTCIICFLLTTCLILLFLGVLRDR